MSGLKIYTDNGWIRVGDGAGDFVFAVDGTLAAVTNVPNALIAAKDGEFVNCYIYCKSPGTAGSTIVDINKNGTTIFTTQANRPTLAFDDANGWAVAIPDVLVCVAGDVFALDIDQIATGAADLVVVLSLSSSPNAQSAANALIASMTTVQTRTQGIYSQVISGDGTVITPLNIVFTPAKAGNKVILEWVINGEGWHDAVFIVTRNGTILANASDASNNRYAGIAASPYDTNNDTTLFNAVVKIIDENSLGVATTYSVLVRSSYGLAFDFYLNRTVASAGADSNESTLSTAIATEINT